MWLKLKEQVSLAFPIKKERVQMFGRTRRKTYRVATFHESMKMMLIAGQLFALNPVTGVCDNVSNIRFKWLSWRCLYAFISICGQTFITIMCTNGMLSTKTTLESATSVIFYGTTCLTMAIFIQIAREWPALTKHVALTESLDPNSDRRLLYKCNFTCAIVLSMAMLEHILSLLSAFAGAIACHPDFQLYESFVRYFYPWVFNYLPYSFYLGLITQFIHFQSTFIWNFSDLFVICMSYYLASRLENVNKRLKKAQGKYLPDTFWRLIREDYTRVTELVRRVDNVINGITFISFANNLFFICLQLFNTLEDGVRGTSRCPGSATAGTTPLKGYEQAVYFLFSLVFLMSRSVAVSLIAAQVNSASLVPAPILYEVPSPVYCMEVQRLLEQVNSDNVALTGLQFFNITRGLLLTVAGTIVTYELVMVQFSSSSSQPNPVTPTASTLSINNTSTT